jgi:glycerol-3-phosphate dehydrogenase
VRLSRLAAALPNGGALMAAEASRNRRPSCTTDGTWGGGGGGVLAPYAPTTGAKRGLASQVMPVGRAVDEIVDVAVIGGGVVGCAVARAAAVSGHSVVVYEREDSVAAGAASSGNSGLGHTGYDAPDGSLEQRLLRRSISLHQALFRSLGLRQHHAGGCPRSAGSLVVAWSLDEVDTLRKVLEENHRSGDREVRWVEQPELGVLEPALAHTALAAVHCPHEVVVEPWLVPVAYAENAMRHGAVFCLGTDVVGVEVNDDHRDGSGGHASTTSLTVRAADGSGSTRTQVARVVVNCGGLFGDDVENLRQVDGGSPFTVTPRKGAFALFAPPPPPSQTGAVLPRHIIEMAPTGFTKGVIVWVNLHGQLVVGPTALDVESRDDRTVTPAELAWLSDFGATVIPALAECTLVGTYAGLRPATQFRDYQIGSNPDTGWITVGGIRSTGLSASPGIAEHTCDLISRTLRGDRDRPPPSSLLGISTAAANPAGLSSATAVANEEAPPLSLLKQDYLARADGMVSLWGREWRVTHPQTFLGFGATH